MVLAKSMLVEGSAVAVAGQDLMQSLDLSHLQFHAICNFFKNGVFPFNLLVYKAECRQIWLLALRWGQSILEKLHL